MSVRAHPRTGARSRPGAQARGAPSVEYRLDEVRASAARDRQPHRDGPAVLRDDLADWPGDAVAGQGPVAAQARTGLEQLLDRAASGARARDHEGPVLMTDFLAELWRFMRVRKKFWLLPILLMMVVFGGLVVLTKGSALAPFIYTLF